MCEPIPKYDEVLADDGGCCAEQGLVPVTLVTFALEHNLLSAGVWEKVSVDVEAHLCLVLGGQVRIEKSVDGLAIQRDSDANRLGPIQLPEHLIFFQKLALGNDIVGGAR